MKIKYTVGTYIKEEKELEIEDTKNIFLQGNNPYDGLNTYLGIWTNEKYLLIITLISGRNIRYEYSTNKNIYTYADIKEYLENNKNVKIISRDEFKEQLQKITSILKI